MITSGNFSKMLYPGLAEIYSQEAAEHPDETGEIFEMRKSTRAYEEVMDTVGLGAAEIIPEGGSITYEDMRQGFVSRFTHIEYGLGFVITRIMMEDNQYGEFGSMYAKQLARSLSYTNNLLGANVLNRATNSSYTGADAVALGSASHVNKSGGTFTNMPASAVDISEAALEQAHIDIGRWTDDKGLPMAYKAKKLIIPVELEFEVDRILKTPYRVGTANNDINAIKAKGILPGGYAVNHFLTDTDAWTIITDAPSGLICWDRRPASFENDSEFDTAVAKFKGTFRKSYGWANPRGVYHSAGA